MGWTGRVGAGGGIIGPFTTTHWRSKKREPGKRTGGTRKIVCHCLDYDSFLHYATAYVLHLLMLGGQGLEEAESCLAYSDTCELPGLRCVVCRMISAQ